MILSLTLLTNITSVLINYLCHEDTGACGALTDDLLVKGEDTKKLKKLITNTITIVKGVIASHSAGARKKYN